MHYYQHNIKTFNNATRHLTHIERALYRDLIELYYDTEKPIRADKLEELERRLLAKTAEEKESLRRVLAEYFTKKDGYYVHDRCEKELEKYREQKALKRRAGKASAEKRWGQKENEKITGVTTLLNTCVTPVQQVCNKPITNNQEPITNKKELAPNGACQNLQFRPAQTDENQNQPEKAENAKDGENSQTVTPPQKSEKIPYRQILEIYHDVLPELPKVQKLTTKRKGQIRARWISGDIDNLDDWRDYFLLVKESNFLTGKVQPQNNRRPFRADLEWLTNETNFTKVWEGRYHGQ